MTIAARLADLETAGALAAGVPPRERPGLLPARSFASDDWTSMADEDWSAAIQAYWK